MQEHLCPVCGLYTFSDTGSFEICDICGWEDDPLQEKDPAFAGGANKMCLNDAKAAFAERSSEDGNLFE